MARHPVCTPLPGYSPLNPMTTRPIDPITRSSRPPTRSNITNSSIIRQWHTTMRGRYSSITERRVLRP